MIKKIVCVHGWSSGPDKEWWPWFIWLAGRCGYEIIAPVMPHPDDPTITDWIRTLQDSVGMIDEHTIFVAHSIGCQTVMRYLSTVSHTIGWLYFVAPWLVLQWLEWPEVETLAAPWLDLSPIHFGHIVDICPVRHIILSDNDYYVDYTTNKALFAKYLHPIVHTLHNAWHIAGIDGIHKLPLLADLLWLSYEKN